MNGQLQWMTAVGRYHQESFSGYYFVNVAGFDVPTFPDLS